MSSSNNGTPSSSVPPGQTPSFFRHIGTAYSKALEALWSPTPPTHSPRRPDPHEVDRGPSTVQSPRRPPAEIEVETVYSNDTGTHHGVPVVSQALSSSPVSLFSPIAHHHRPSPIHTDRVMTTLLSTTMPRQVTIHLQVCSQLILTLLRFLRPRLLPAMTSVMTPEMSLSVIHPTT